MKKRFLCVACCCMLFAASLSAQDVLNAELAQRVDNIAKTIKSDEKSAAEEFDGLLKGKNKKNISLLVAIGQAYLDNDMPAEAQAYADRALKVDSKSSQAYLFMGDVALAGKNVGKACGYYEQAILFDADCSEAYYKYARAYIGVNPQLSIDMLTRLKTNHPENIDVDRELANVYYTMGNYSQAKSAYDDFMAQGKPGLQDYMQYSMLLYLNKDYQKSLDMTAKGLAEDANNHLLKRLKMYDLYELKSYKDGLAAADAFFQDPTNPDYVYLDYLYRGRLYLADKQTDKAMESFNKALELDAKKEHPEVAKEASEAYESLQNYPEAIRLYQIYLDAVGDKAEISDLFLLGRLNYMAAGMTEQTEENKKAYLTKADEVFAEVSQRVPDNYLGYFWRARTNAMADPETVDGLAKPYYESALAILEKNPNSSKSIMIECQSYLGYYYFLQKDYDQSKIYWDKILVLDPENATAKQALEGLNSMKKAAAQKAN